jgi:hypothetical protein
MVVQAFVTVGVLQQVQVAGRVKSGINRSRTSKIRAEPPLKTCFCIQLRGAKSLRFEECRGLRFSCTGRGFDSSALLPAAADDGDDGDDPGRW